MTVPPKLIAAGLILLTLAYICAQIVLGAGLVDDAYIFMRYADNAVRGEGVVFNPGERVEGYTSPLWLFITCLLALLPFDLPDATRVVSAMMGLGAIVAVFVSGARRAGVGAVRPLICAMFLATNPAFVYWTASGMETSLLTLLMLASFLVFAARVDTERSLVIPGLCFGLATLARPEMIVLLPVFLLFIGKSARRSSQFLAPLALPVMHLLWRWSYYGTLLPNTYHAKVGLPLWSRLAAGMNYSARFFLAFAPVLLLIGLMALHLMRKKEENRQVFALAAAGVSFWILGVTWVGGDHFNMLRFFVPLLPILAWLIAIGGSRTPAALRMFGLAALLLAQNVSVQFLAGGRMARHEVALAQAWSDVGRWLGRNLPPDASLASEVVGAITYHSRLRMLDLFGLTDREVAVHGKTWLAGAVGHQRYHTDYVLERKPDYIIFRSSGWSESERPPAFAKLYDYPLFDLERNPLTSSLYSVGSVRMDNGKYIHWLKLKSGAR